MKNGVKSRISGVKATIDSEAVKAFFEKRGKAFDAAHPYTSVLYQDQDPGLAEQRDAHEKSKILPMLHLSGQNRVLDIGCGIGRWADAVLPLSASYIGVDVSESLIEQARHRIGEKARFYVLPATDIGQLGQDYARAFDRIIISGLLIYLNDDDVSQLINSLAPLCNDNCRIYIREPFALNERLTLNRYWSDELQAEYSSIYRNEAEIRQALSPLADNGFVIGNIARLYEQDALNNRQETAQFYFFADRGSPL